jgi:hypothetical protein
MECGAFQDCTTECQVIGTEECLEKCAGEWPSGWALYDQWVSCSACTTCPSTCGVAFSFFCPQPL